MLIMNTKNIFLFIPFSFLPFSPLLTFLSSIILLLFSSNLTYNKERIILSLFCIYSLLFIVASRSYIDELEHDLSHYYLVYKSLGDGNINELFGFGNGLEIGWPILYGSISFFFPNLTPIGIAIINSGICCILFLIWLEKYGYAFFHCKNKSIAAAFVFTFLSVQTFGYLERQAISTVFILFAISTNKYKSLVYTILATSFHLTAIPLVILYKLTLSRYTTQVKLLSFFIIIIIFRLFYQSILENLFILKEILPVLGKLNYYIITFNDFKITSYRFMILVFPLLLSILFLLRKEKKTYHIYKFIAINSFLYISFIGIPLLPERINFSLLYLYGLFVYFLFYKNYKELTFFFLIIYILFFILEKTNILNNGINQFWVRYPIVDLSPFYYFIF